MEKQTSGLDDLFGSQRLSGEKMTRTLKPQENILYPLYYSIIKVQHGDLLHYHNREGKETTSGPSTYKKIRPLMRRLWN